jgi:hypothetical protein
MSVILPLLTGEATTTGAAPASITFALTDGSFGQRDFELTGELAGDPTTTFSWSCKALYSVAAGVASMIDQGAPVILDPDGKAFVVTLDATGSSARLNVTGLVGENWVWAVKMHNTGRTRLPTGTTSYIDAAVHASVTADFVYTGANVVNDADMEAAGVGAWTAGPGATLTKEVGTPHGGSQCLRVTNAGGAGYANQSVITSGARWNASVWHRTDGGGTSASAESVGGVVATAADAAWTQIVQSNKYANSAYNLFKYNAGGTYSEFDDASVIRLPIASAVADQVTGGPGVAQATAANRPTYIDAGDYFLCDGLAQYFKLNGTIGTRAGTIWAWIYQDANPATNGYVIGMYDQDELYISSSTARALSVRISGRSYGIGTIPLATWWLVGIGWDDSQDIGRAFVNTTVSSNTLISKPTTLNSPIPYFGALNTSGVASGYYTGRMAVMGCASRLLSEAEWLDLYRATYRS